MTSMGISRWIVGIVAGVAVFGCGGGSGSGSGPANTEVSGLVFDTSGNVVRGAKVWINGYGETSSNSSGAFVLTGIKEGDFKVRAEITKDGSTYKGENVARTFDSERTKSVNITVIKESLLARLQGHVIDNQGFTVEGARVIAISTNPDIVNSTFEITDSEGKFDLDRLMGGENYRIVASGRGYNSDSEVVNIDSGDTQEIILTLKNATDPLLPAPTGLEGVAWTSPSETTRSSQNREAYQAIKKAFDPRTPVKTITRETVQGNWVEADLYWDAYPNNDAHIGFGIYRRFGNSGQFTAVDFLRDPEVELYADSDSLLQEFQTWSYLITAINTNYPDTSNSQSNDSNTAVVETLSDLNLNSVSQSPLTFSWQSGSGSDQYYVYLYDRYPGIGVSPAWTGAPTANLQLQYTGSSLQSGKRYYYVVIGTANSLGSRTISPIGEFVAN